MPSVSHLDWCRPSPSVMEAGNTEDFSCRAGHGTQFHLCQVGNTFAVIHVALAIDSHLQKFHDSYRENKKL
jgi:hypothetical protein